MKRRLFDYDRLPYINKELFWFVYLCGVYAVITVFYQTDVRGLPHWLGYAALTISGIGLLYILAYFIVVVRLVRREINNAGAAPSPEIEENWIG